MVQHCNAWCNVAGSCRRCTLPAGRPLLRPAFPGHWAPTDPQGGPMRARVFSDLRVSPARLGETLKPGPPHPEQVRRGRIAPPCSLICRADRHPFDRGELSLAAADLPQCRARFAPREGRQRRPERPERALGCQVRGRGIRGRAGELRRGRASGAPRGGRARSAADDSSRRARRGERRRARGAAAGPLHGPGDIEPPRGGRPAAGCPRGRLLVPEGPPANGGGGLLLAVEHHPRLLCRVCGVAMGVALRGGSRHGASGCSGRTNCRAAGSLCPAKSVDKWPNREIVEGC